jgi:hypothetical protein
MDANRNERGLISAQQLAQTLAHLLSMPQGTAEQQGYGMLGSFPTQQHALVGGVQPQQQNFAFQTPYLVPNPHVHPQNQQFVTSQGMSMQNGGAYAGNGAQMSFSQGFGQQSTGLHHTQMTADGMVRQMGYAQPSGVASVMQGSNVPMAIPHSLYPSSAQMSNGSDSDLLAALAPLSLDGVGAGVGARNGGVVGAARNSATGRAGPELDGDVALLSTLLGIVPGGAPSGPGASGAGPSDKRLGGRNSSSSLRGKDEEDASARAKRLLHDLRELKTYLASRGTDLLSVLASGNNTAAGTPSTATGTGSEGGTASGSGGDASASISDAMGVSLPMHFGVDAEGLGGAGQIPPNISLDADSIAEILGLLSPSMNGSAGAPLQAGELALAASGMTTTTGPAASAGLGGGSAAAFLAGLDPTVLASLMAEMASGEYGNLMETDQPQ